MLDPLITKNHERLELYQHDGQKCAILYYSESEEKKLMSLLYRSKKFKDLIFFDHNIQRRYIEHFGTTSKIGKFMFNGTTDTRLTKEAIKTISNRLRILDIWFNQAPNVIEL